MRTKVEKEGEKWELGRRLKQAREAAGYTQEQAAKLRFVEREVEGKKIKLRDAFRALWCILRYWKMD